MPKTLDEPAATEHTMTLLGALLAVQAEAPTLPKDKTNPHYQSKYTPLDTIVERIGPILNKHGLVWITLPGRDEHGDPALHYRLAHAATGEAITGTMPLLLSKADPQGMGSGLTYARRYSICAVLNLVADDDDDGHIASTASGGSFPLSDAQRKLLNNLLREKDPSAEQLTVMLTELGVPDVDLSDAHWLDTLTGGKNGTASGLITWLKEKPLPDGKSPVSDVPDDGLFPPAEDAS